MVGSYDIAGGWAFVYYFKSKDLSVVIVRDGRYYSLARMNLQPRFEGVTLSGPFHRPVKTIIMGQDKET